MKQNTKVALPQMGSFEDAFLKAFHDSESVQTHTDECIEYTDNLFPTRIDVPCICECPL